MIDPQSRCTRCGRIMAAHESATGGGDFDVWWECQRPECREADREDLNAWYERATEHLEDLRARP